MKTVQNELQKQLANEKKMLLTLQSRFKIGKYSLQMSLGSHLEARAHPNRTILNQSTHDLETISSEPVLGTQIIQFT